MRISTSLFSLLFFFPANLFSQQTYRLDFQSNSIDLPICFNTPSQGKIILASQIFDNNIFKESTASYLAAQADTFEGEFFGFQGGVSLEGKLLKTYAIGSQNETKLNLNEFPGGTYLLEIQSSTDSKHVQKFIIDVAK